ELIPDLRRGENVLGTQVRTLVLGLDATQRSLDRKRGREGASAQRRGERLGGRASMTWRSLVELLEQQLR
ncbi:hypothetical protein KIPB_012786, partial [Kipferlia bialata]